MSFVVQFTHGLDCVHFGHGQNVILKDLLACGACKVYARKVPSIPVVDLQGTNCAKVLYTEQDVWSPSRFSFSTWLQKL